MIKDNLHLEAKEKLQQGIDKIAQAVGRTMGTGGSNAILEAIESPGHIATNDGYSIANAIVFSDPIEDMGRKILLESINRANKSSGDGSSTTCVVTASIIREGMKHDENPMQIKRDMEACIPWISEQLDNKAKQVVFEDQINLTLLEQVATVSAEDEEIGKRIAEIYGIIGPKGLIHWDISKTPEDSYVVGSGITVDGATYVTPYLCDANENGTNTNQVRLKNPKILITKQKISSAGDFEKIAATLDSKNIKDLIVFCDDIDPLVVPSLVQTRMMRGFRIIPIKMPVLWKDWWFEDLALATKATVVDPDAGLALKDLTIDHLGTVGNIVITKEDTHLDGIQDVSDHIKALEAEATDDSKLRASRLNTKTARYFVGAHSDSALSYRRLKVEDAISASYQALQGGVVAGGGSALASLSQHLPSSTGGKILKIALQSVAKQIVTNAGYPNTSLDGYDGTHGFDSRTMEYVDLFEAGIIDPKNVVVNAVKNAISVAATVLTAPTIVTLPREEKDYLPTI